MKAERYLETSDFDELFDDSFARLQVRFWKVEVQQTYAEPDTEAFVQLHAGRWSRARSLIVDQGVSLAESNNALTGVEFRRLRLVTRPLTLYTRLELELYRVLHAHGNAVSLVEGSVPFAHDLLIFDSSRVLVHNYVTPGVSVGGWLVTDEATIDATGRLFDEQFRQGLDPESFHKRWVADADLEASQSVESI